MERCTWRPKLPLYECEKRLCVTVYVVKARKQCVSCVLPKSSFFLALVESDFSRSFSTSATRSCSGPPHRPVLSLSPPTLRPRLAPPSSTSWLARALQLSATFNQHSLLSSSTATDVSTHPCIVGASQQRRSATTQLSHTRDPPPAPSRFAHLCSFPHLIPHVAIFATPSIRLLAFHVAFELPFLSSLARNLSLAKVTLKPPHLLAFAYRFPTFRPLTSQAESFRLLVDSPI